MPAKRPRKRKDGQRDNRSRPRLKECSPLEQRYILRKITPKGLGSIMRKYPEGYNPSLKELRKLAWRFKVVKWRLVLMSTRPRPKHILTCWWEEDEDSGEWVFRHRKANR